MSPVSIGSADEVHQVVRDEILKLQAFSLGACLPAAFWEHIPAVGMVPPAEEDRIPLEPSEDKTACYFPESMVIILWGEIFMHRLQDLIKDHPEWNIDRLIKVCVLHLHAQHSNAGLSAVLSDILTYSSSALDNLIDHMYLQGAKWKLLWEIAPLGTTPVEHISTLVHISNQETDVPEPHDAE